MIPIIARCGEPEVLPDPLFARPAAVVEVEGRAEVAEAVSDAFGRPMVVVGCPGVIKDGSAALSASNHDGRSHSLN